MRFSLIPRELKFFDMFDDIAATLTRASTKFLEMLTKFDSLPARGLDIKKEEETGDGLVEKTLKALDKTFITPFDREDTHNLVTRLDDVLDNLEETAHRFEVFRIEKPTRASIQLANIIKESAQHLEEAIHHLRTMKKAEAIQKRILLVGTLENEADQLYREVDAALFDDAVPPDDILSLIKWRELYSWLEETVDACKEVANVISEIVIKGT
jgi:predicted phosphate transport protein (TIGR00153 family)